MGLAVTTVWQAKRPHFVLTIALLFFTACSLLNAPQPELEGSALLTGEAVLRCSQECSARGQCGTAIADGQSLVFGSASGPATSSHELVFPADARVRINDATVRTVETLATAVRFDLTFYHLTVIDQVKQGWVAEWCVAAP